MVLSKNTYVLESHDEHERLDRQSRMAAYDFKLDLQFLKVLEGQKILDAGCGNGIVSDYLSRRAPRVNVVGWDFSKDRVQAAQAKYGAAKNITFAQNNLLELKPDSEMEAFGGGRFDSVVCRFVLRHFSSAQGKKVIQNLFGALKPGGTIYCVDVDGILGEVFHGSSFLKKALIRLREAKTVSFQIARKMPSLLLEHGFENVDWRVLTSEFRGDDLLQEIDNLQEAIQNAEAFATKALGGMANFVRFQKEYFSVLREPGCVLIYNRIVAMGTKPTRRPKLISMNE